MPAPYNYSINVPNPMQGFMSGMQLGQAGVAARQAREKRDRQAAAQAQFDTFMDIENPTFEDYQKIARSNPQMAQGLMSVWDTQDEAYRKNQLRFGGQLLSAFGASPDVGITLLEERIEAERAAGREEEAKGYETWLEIAKVNPSVAQRSIGTMISVLPGGKEVIDAVTAYGAEVRAEEEHPFQKRAATAEAINAETESTLGLLELAYKPDQLAVEFDLSQQQVKQAKAAIAASNAAAKKSGAEAEKIQAQAAALASGVILPEKRPEVEAKMRKEYTDQTKDYTKVRDAYGRMLAVGTPETLEDEGPADLALIFNYMKMLDPGSTVREGEFANAENAGGAWGKIAVQYNKLLAGARLTPEVRASFLRQAKALYGAQAQGEKKIRAGLTRIATGYGLNTENIFYEIGALTPPTKEEITEYLGLFDKPGQANKEPGGGDTEISEDLIIETPEGTFLFQSEEAARDYRIQSGLE